MGNYLGALRSWKRIADETEIGYECLFGTADLHSLTALPEAKTLKHNRYSAIANILASGVDPKKCIIFHQSGVPEHTELYWILTCLTSIGALNRMTQWKLKSQVEAISSIFSEKTMGATKAGILLYPVLQAADILLYNSTHVPVGEDQAQHLELCRGIASTFNSTYGQFFTLPQTLLTPTRKVGSLRNPSKKMSKSDPDQQSCIYLNDDADVIARKLRKAVTDSIQGPIIYDPVNRPGVANLINIIGGITDKETSKIISELSWVKNHKQLKDHVTELVVEEFKDKRLMYNLLMQDKEYLDSVCNKGQIKAREIASSNLREIKRLVGLM